MKEIGGSDLHAYLGKLIITLAWQEMFKVTQRGDGEIQQA